MRAVSKTKKKNRGSSSCRGPTAPAIQPQKRIQLVGKKHSKSNNAAFCFLFFELFRRTFFHVDKRQDDTTNRGARTPPAPSAQGPDGYRQKPRRQHDHEVAELPPSLALRLLFLRKLVLLFGVVVPDPLGDRLQLGAGGLELSCRFGIRFGQGLRSATATVGVAVVLSVPTLVLARMLFICQCCGC